MVENVDNWRLQRKKVLSRDACECQFCGMAESTHKTIHSQGLDIHHIIPENEGGSDHPENLITLCRGCHSQLESITQKILGVMRETSGLQQTAEEIPNRVPNDLRQQILEDQYERVPEAEIPE